MRQNACAATHQPSVGAADGDVIAHDDSALLGLPQGVYEAADHNFDRSECTREQYRNVRFCPEM